MGSVAETARLIASYEFQNKGAAGTNAAIGQLGKLESTAARGTGAFGTLGKVSAGVGSGLSTLGSRVKQLGSSLLLVSGVGGVLGLAGALTKSVTGAKDFSQAMELLHTQAGATQAEVDSMRGALLDLAPSLGTTPEILAAGLYHIESAGLRGAKALDILKIAAEGAKTGNADLESTTNALIAANQSGIKGVEDMGAAMGTLNGIVGAGNMRMQDLTDAFTTGVLSSAKNFGVSIQSVGAALATLTDQGQPAIDSATRINSAMRLMAAPTPKAINLLKSIGLEAGTLATDMRSPGGITSAISDLREHLDKSGLSLSEQAALLANAFGGKQSGAILSLVGNVELLQQKTEAVAKGASTFGEAWAKTQEEAAFKFAKFQATMDATFIRIGNVLLPTVTEALAGVGDWVTTHQKNITDFVAGAVNLGKSAVGVIGNVIGAVGKLWSFIPGPLQELLIKGFAADRTIKFLFGFSPIKFAADTLAGLVGKIAGNKLVPQLVQAAGPIPVFVTNPGFGLPGGSPIVGGGEAVAGAEGAAMGGLRGLINKIPLAVVAAVDVAAIVGVVVTWFKVNGDIQVASQFEKDVEAKRRKDAGDNLSELQQLRKDIEGQIAAGGGDPLSSLLKGFFVNPQLKKQLDEIEAKIKALGGVVPPSTAPGGSLAPGAGGPNKGGATGPTSSGGVPVYAPGGAPAHGYFMTYGGSVGATSDYGTRHPTGAAPQISAEQFLKTLATSPFMGPAAYKSIFEKSSTEKARFDPTGSIFLTALQNLKNPKAPAVLGEIKGHLKELQNLEAYYIANGDTKNALLVQGVINKVDTLIGVTKTEHAATDAQQKATKAAIVEGHEVTRRGFTANLDGVRSTASVTNQHLRTLEGVERGVSGNTATIANKNFSPTFVANVDITQTLSVSPIARTIQRQQTAIGRGLTPGAL